jgi:integrase
MARGLTALKVANAKPAAKRVEIADRGKPGLYLVIQPSGAKSWAVRYRRHSDRKPRKYTLPGFPSLAAAHKLAQAALDEVAAGGDPAANKQSSRAAAPSDADDIGEAFHEFLVKHVRRSDGRPIRESSKRQTAFLLGFRRSGEGWVASGNGVLGRWRGRSVRSIRRADVIDLVDAIASRTPIAANRTLAALRTFFNWRAARDESFRSPCGGIHDPAAEKSRDRVLSDDELAALWRAAETVGYPFGAMVQVLVLGGLRRDEARASQWPEIDLEGRRWLIPGSRTKNGSDHLVPLSEPLMAVLGALPATSPLLFSLNGETPIGGLTRMKRALDREMARELGAEPPRWTLHDIRRTVATGLQRLGFAQEITESVLNHRRGKVSGVAAIYGRHDFATEKRAALEAWARHVESIVDGGTGKVVSFARPAVS